VSACDPNGGLLCSAPCLASLSEEDRQRLGRSARYRRIATGEYVYRQGDGARYVYFIRRGRVKVAQRSVDGKEVILGIYGPNDMLGCCGILGNVVFPCYAQAVEPTAIDFVPRDDFFALLCQKSSVAATLLQHMIARLRIAHRKMRSLAVEPAQRRVLAVLLEVGQKLGRVQGGQVYVPARFTRQQLAQMAGVTLETASRVITKLKRAGIIRTSRRELVVTQPTTAAQIAHEDKLI
jgi:CRP/FNR family transcriptional regulator